MGSSHALLIVTLAVVVATFVLVDSVELFSNPEPRSDEAALVQSVQPDISSTESPGVLITETARDRTRDEAAVQSAKSNEDGLQSVRPTELVSDVKSARSSTAPVSITKRSHLPRTIASAKVEYAPPSSGQQAEPSEEARPRRFSIAGRVLDDKGMSVPGIVVVARPTRLFDPEYEALPFTGDMQVFSGYGGHFYFTELPDGEYRLRTVETEDYPVAQLTVRAGEHSVNLVLRGAKVQQRVHGVVETPEGRPLAGVRVTAMLSGSKSTGTGADGRYEIAATLMRGAGSYSVRYQREGYAEVRVRVRNTAGARSAIRSDVVMDPLGALTTVVGVLTGPRGNPVDGAMVRIHSAHLARSHQAVSDRWGRFWMSEVEVGDDYRLWINPKAGFRDYSRARMQVPEQGLELRVALESVDSSSLTGQMLDLYGKPIPHFTLTLRSTSALWHSVPVSSDKDGHFVVDSVPDGGLTFTTRSTPVLQVTGIDLAPGEAANVDLVLDWGHYDVFGQVLDSHGLPVTTPEVSLSWSHRADGAQSLSTRRTQADADGRFSFSRLGPGPHIMRVTAPGYRSEVFNVDPREQIDGLVLQLEEVSL